MTKKIEVKNISKTFLTELGDFKVLDDISFDLYEGEIISILGPSGSGKSTLLNNISGLLNADEGEININGKLGYMFQKDHLLNWRTVWKNITLGLEINKNKDKENINTEKKEHKCCCKDKATEHSCNCEHNKCKCNC